jgi:hypothetical protein
VAQKERNLYGPDVVHDGGIPHGRSEDPLIRAAVLLRPPGVALPDRARCKLRPQPACRAAHKTRNTCFNEKSYE